MTTTTRLFAPAAAGLALGLALTGCSQSGGDETTSDGGTIVGADASTTDEATTEAATSEEPATEAGDAAEGLAAIATAEADAGGIAFTIDSDDDGSWDVDVSTGAAVVEVRVSADGSEVVRSENDDLDADDQAEIDAATLTLSEAIEAAAAGVDGTLDDADLSDDGGTLHYEVTFQATDNSETDIDVDAATGEILRTS